MSKSDSYSHTITDAPPMVEERMACVEGDEIPYLVVGESDKRVLLVHGAGASRADWLELMPALSNDYTLYAPDLIGFGDTPRREFPHTPGYIADFLSEFMDDVGIERAALVGHSLGGRVCLELARKHPNKVSKLALEAPMGFGKIRWPGRLFSLTRWWLYSVMGLKSPYPLLAFPIVEQDSTEFQSLSCETLLLWGDKDLYFPPEHGLAALDLIPNSSLKVYAGVGHSLHRSAPERFSSDVSMFLQENE